MVRPEAGLALRVVLHYKVHGGMTLVKTIESHGNHMTTSLESHGNHMTTSMESHGNHMTTSMGLPWNGSQGRPFPAQEPHTS